MSIKELLTRILNCLKVDYVIEEGTSGIWTYRKWNSGIAECWGTFDNSVKSWGAWGSLYEGLCDTYHATFPSGLFISAPSVQATPKGSGYEYFLGVYTAPTSTQTAHYIPLRPNNTAGAMTFSLEISAKGKWK